VKCDFHSFGVVLPTGRPPSLIRSSGILILRRSTRTSECIDVDDMQFRTIISAVAEVGISDASP
jgi:hypothetical protein